MSTTKQKNSENSKTEEASDRQTRRNTFGKGKNQRKKGKTTPPSSTVPTDTGVPPPAHLSKTESAFKDDPLYQEAFFLEATDFEAEPGQLEIYPGHEMITPLIEQEYKSCAAQSGSFAKKVPESAFAYYCAVHACARDLQLCMLNGHDLSHELQYFMEMVRDAGFCLPETFSLYLAGRGSTTIPNGRDLKFNMPDIHFEEARGMDGWFGRVSEFTHYLYKTYPCLPVYAMRIQRDLAYTDNEEAPVAQPPEELLGVGDEQDDVEEEPEEQDEVEVEAEQQPVGEPPAGRRRAPRVPAPPVRPRVPRDWDLPDRLRPRPADHGFPNPNLLGWKRATRLSHEAQDLVRRAGITQVDFPSALEGVAYNAGLMASVSTEIRAIHRIKKGEFPTASTGSRGQLVFVEPGRLAQYEASQACTPRCAFSTLGVTAYLGASFGYRVRHTVARDIRPWSVYDFDNFRDVPDEWAATINRCREREPQEINLRRFGGVRFTPASRDEKLVSKAVVT